jgi:hypothetical protein
MVYVCPIFKQTLGAARLGFEYQKRFRAMPDGRKKPYLVQVPDPAERDVMRAIATARTATPAASWDAIRRDLAGQGIKTRTGSPWSTSRIRRAFQVETVLELVEARGGRPADVFLVLGRLADRGRMAARRNGRAGLRPSSEGSVPVTGTSAPRSNEAARR